MGLSPYIVSHWIRPIWGEKEFIILLNPNPLYISPLLIQIKTKPIMDWHPIENIVNDWMDEPLKSAGSYLSYKMKTWEDAEAKRKKDESGKDKKD